ncbi:MAG: hypothetical protein K0R38_5541, partial [Polyangiaceae bacterium]|nr:hypothetical protein [Polyangiaceae bacterium]
SVVGSRSGDTISLGDRIELTVDDVAILRRQTYGRRIAPEALLNQLKDAPEMPRRMQRLESSHGGPRGKQREVPGRAQRVVRDSRGGEQAGGQARAGRGGNQSSSGGRSARTQGSGQGSGAQGKKKRRDERPGTRNQNTSKDREPNPNKSAGGRPSRSDATGRATSPRSDATGRSASSRSDATGRATSSRSDATGRGKPGKSRGGGRR